MTPASRVGGAMTASTRPIPAPLPTLRLPSLWVLILPLSSRARTPIASSLTWSSALVPCLQRFDRIVGGRLVVEECQDHSLACHVQALRCRLFPAEQGRNARPQATQSVGHEGRPGGHHTRETRGSGRHRSCTHHRPELSAPICPVCVTFNYGGRARRPSVRMKTPRSARDAARRPADDRLSMIHIGGPTWF